MSTSSFTPVTDNTNISTIKLAKLMEEILMALTPKEREVIIKRFSLDGKNKCTLESIGKSFNVTRERVRQIEKGGKLKLRRIAANTKLKVIHETAREFITNNGGLMVIDDLVNEIFKQLYRASKLDANFIRLAIDIDVFRTFYAVNHVDVNKITSIQKDAYDFFKKKSSIMTVPEAFQEFFNMTSKKYDNLDEKFFRASLQVDVRFKEVPEGVGLREWRFVHPRSVRDKAYIVLKRASKPLHFVDICNQVISTGFDKKQFTVPALHNELIRCKDVFVLVGRGYYSLREWGVEPGSVKDVIYKLLEDNGKPMSKQEIIQGVLKTRNVREGTISLNLQKHFKRVGRATYDLREKVGKK